MTQGRLKTILIISVLLNIFLAGALAGGAAWLHARHPMIAAGTFRIAGAQLPVQERRIFRAAMRDTRRSMRPTIVESRAARARAIELLRQPTLDQIALATAAARARNADAAVRASVEERAIGVLATFPAADRAKIADGMESRGRR